MNKNAPLAAPPSPTAKRFKIAVPDVKNRAIKLCLAAVEGFGKTTFGSQTPNPLIVMADGEDGYETLLKAGRAPAVPAIKVGSWGDLLELLKQIKRDSEGVETLVFDAVGGFERFCQEYVCNRDFNGDWGSKGFRNYMQGYAVSAQEWLIFLSHLDDLHNQLKMNIILLSHTTVKTHKNPLGPDFDRYVPDAHERVWGHTAKWVDAILFGNFKTLVDKDNKGCGGVDRTIFTESRDSYVAKNRFGLPEEIALPSDHKQMWSTVRNLIK